MVTTTKSRTAEQRVGDELINDQFHALLRDAAEKREGRELAHVTQNQAEARRASEGLLALARGGATKS
jgi:hypothetical protein